MLWHYLFEIFEKQLRIHADLGAMTGWSLLNFSLGNRVLLRFEKGKDYRHSDGFQECRGKRRGNSERHDRIACNTIVRSTEELLETISDILM